MALGDKSLDLESNINLTPFVDLMTTLLIVFMITTPLMQYGMDVNLPKAKTPIMERTQKDIVLTIQRDGSIYIGDDKTPVTLGFLEEKLKSIYEGKENKDLYIKADESVLYGRVISIMAAAKAAGVERIGMITQPISVKEEKNSTDDRKSPANK